MTDEERLVWGQVQELERRILKQGESLDLGAETRALLISGARLVSILPLEAEEAVRSVSTATTLLEEIGQRLQRGSSRLGEVDSQVDRLRDGGDLVGARKVLDAALVAEVVPHYREQMEIRLEYLATFEAIFLTGHVVEDFHPWGQLRALALRVQQGRALERRDALRDFLWRSAPSLAMTGVEIDEAFKTTDGVEALLTRMLERIDEGRERISQALYRMIRHQESGDLEGARQQMREVLAVEVVPRYRRMAEENLMTLERSPQTN